MIIKLMEKILHLRWVREASGEDGALILHPEISNFSRDDRLRNPLGISGANQDNVHKNDFQTNFLFNYKWLRRHWFLPTKLLKLMLSEVRVGTFIGGRVAIWNPDKSNSSSPLSSASLIIFSTFLDFPFFIFKNVNEFKTFRFPHLSLSLHPHNFIPPLIYYYSILQPPDQFIFNSVSPEFYFSTHLWAFCTIK